MKTWLKGSLIGLAIGIIYFFVSFYDPGCPTDNCGPIKESLLIFTHLVFLATCGKFGGDSAMFCSITFYPLVNAVIFVVLGGLIGLIIQKKN